MKSIALRFRVHRLGLDGEILGQVQDYGDCGLRAAVDRANQYAAATEGKFGLVCVEILERQLGCFPLEAQP
jgi:hypothetical protein